MHAHLQATRMLPSAVYLLDSKFTPFKLQTSPEFKRNITYFCCHMYLLLLFSLSFFFWRKGKDGEAAVCVSWGLIQLNNGLRRISGNIQLKEEILAHFPKPQNKANQAISRWHLPNTKVYLMFSFVLCIVNLWPLGGGGVSQCSLCLHSMIQFLF